MTPMDEFAKQKIEEMEKAGVYKKAMLGHELTDGKWNMFIESFEGSTTSTNRLRYTFVIQRSEPDDDDIIRWSNISFMIDDELWTKHEFLLEKWEQFQRGLGIEPTEYGLGDHEELFNNLCYQEFRGDVSTRVDKSGRLQVDVQPLSFTGETIDPKSINKGSAPF
jgi:hypothetical protein